MSESHAIVNATLQPVRLQVGDAARAFNLEQPTLVVLGGMDLLRDTSAQKFVKANVLPLIDPVSLSKTPCFTMSYPACIACLRDVRASVTDFHQKHAGSHMATLADAYAQELVKTLMPFLEPVDDKMANEREALCAKTQAYLKNLNFLGYSFGAIVIRHFHDRLKERLGQLGYKESEQQQMLQSISAVTLSDATVIAYPGNEWHFRSLHINSENDARLKPLRGADTVVSCEATAVMGRANQQLLRVNIPAPTRDPEGHQLSSYLESSPIAPSQLSSTVRSRVSRALATMLEHTQERTQPFSMETKQSIGKT